MKIRLNLSQMQKAEIIKNWGRALLVAAVIILAMKSNIFADDNFTTNAKSFINGTVMTWMRIGGTLTVLFGFAGLLDKQHPERIRAFWIVIATGAAIFAAPSIVNMLYANFSSTTINALQ